MQHRTNSRAYLPYVRHARHRCFSRVCVPITKKNIMEVRYCHSIKRLWNPILQQRIAHCFIFPSGIADEGFAVWRFH